MIGLFAREWYLLDSVGVRMIYMTVCLFLGLILVAWRGYFRPVQIGLAL